MKTATDILRDHRIVERPARNGRFRTQCPGCSPNRKKKNERDLSVEITAIGVRWKCHHCDEFEGGELYDEHAAAHHKNAWAKNTGTQNAWAKGRGVFRGAGDQCGNRRSFRGVYS